jgi:hypothetical protein
MALSELRTPVEMDRVNDCDQCTCHAKDMANLLMSRDSRMAQSQRVELEEMVGIMD